MEKRVQSFPMFSYCTHFESIETFCTLIRVICIYVYLVNYLSLAAALAKTVHQLLMQKCKKNIGQLYNFFGINAKLQDNFDLLNMCKLKFEKSTLLKTKLSNTSNCRKNELHVLLNQPASYSGARIHRADKIF